MSESLHNIDKLFRDKIEQHEEEPSSNVWNAIDNDLDKKKIVSVSKKYYKLKWVAMALLLFSLGLGMYILQIRRNNNEIVKKNSIEKLSKNNDSVKSNVKDLNQVLGENDAQIRKTKGLIQYKALQDTGDRNNYITRSGAEDNNKILSDESLSYGPLKEDHTAKLNKAVAISTDGKKKNIVELKDKNNETTITNTEQIKESFQNTFPAKRFNNDILLASKSPEMHYQQLFTVPLFTSKIILSNEARDNASAIENAKTFKEKNKKQKNGSTKTSKEPLFFATLFFSPDIISYNIESDHPRFREDDKDEIKKNESLKFSSTFGFLVGYNINNRWKLQSGATFFTRVTNINSKTIYARSDNNGNVDFRINCFSGSSIIPLKSGNHPAPGDSTNASAKNSLKYLGVPLVLQYAISKGKLSIIPGAGFEVNFLLKNKIETVINTASGKENATTNVQGLRPSYLNGSISLGAEYRLSRKIALSFVPTGRFALSPINEGEPIKTTLNSVGFITGLTFRF
ncbi:MAG: outer membrane beta-barrel protein [Bacteroidota bacterium]|nr:outer membrane beta-barrel protein [Bacteroidota bacterium]